MTYKRFRERWKGFTEGQRDMVRAKANWEHMSLWAVMNEWWARKDPGELKAPVPVEKSYKWLGSLLWSYTSPGPGPGPGKELERESTADCGAGGMLADRLTTLGQIADEFATILLNESAEITEWIDKKRTVLKRYEEWKGGRT